MCLLRKVSFWGAAEDSAIFCLALTRYMQSVNLRCNVDSNQAQENANKSDQNAKYTVCLRRPRLAQAGPELHTKRGLASNSYSSYFYLSSLKPRFVGMHLAEQVFFNEAKLGKTSWRGVGLGMS